MLQKRGQVALFILIGIVVFIAVGAYMVYQSLTSTLSTGDDALIEAVGSGNFDKRTFEVATAGCLEKTLTHAVYLLGERGGYIDLDVVAGEQIAFGQGINAQTQLPEDKFVPLYVTDGQPNSNWVTDTDGEWGTLHARIPTRQFIETSLREFVLANLGTCMGPRIREVEAIVDIIEYNHTGVGDTKEPFFDETMLNLTVRDDDLLITLAYPIYVLDGTVEHRLTSFSAKTSVGMIRLYEVARWFVDTLNTANARAAPEDVYVFDGGECNRYETASDQNAYLLNGRTNIYILPALVGTHYVVRFVDFKPKHIKYRVPFIYQFAVDNVNMAKALGGDTRAPMTCPPG